MDEPRQPTVTILLGWLVAWLVFDLSATMLRSFSGEAGLLVAAIVVGLLVAGGLLLFGDDPKAAFRDLGFRRPSAASLTAAIAIGAALIAFLPIYGRATGTPLAVRPDWPWLAIGILAQAGIAEEALFRGFLFRRLREGRRFWPAAALATLPLAVVHIPILFASGVAVGGAALALSVISAFPLAWLFERSGGSLWPPAILHAAIQGGVKLVATTPEAFPALAIAWIAACAILPWAVFILGGRRIQGDRT